MGSTGGTNKDSGSKKLATENYVTTSISGKENTSNKVTSLSSSSTDTQYPSAKLVYNQLALKQNQLSSANAGDNITIQDNATHTALIISATDTKNTAGSTDTSSKIYLIGATSQAANPQTYSDNEVYVTSGAMTAKLYSLGTYATMEYNSTDNCIEFNFS